MKCTVAMHSKGDSNITTEGCNHFAKFYMVPPFWKCMKVSLGKPKNIQWLHCWLINHKIYKHSIRLLVTLFAMLGHTLWNCLTVSAEWTSDISVYRDATFIANKALPVAPSFEPGSICGIISAALLQSQLQDSASVCSSVMTGCAAGWPRFPVDFLWYQSFAAAVVNYAFGTCCMSARLRLDFIAIMALSKNDIHQHHFCCLQKQWSKLSKSWPFLFNAWLLKK